MITHAHMVKTRTNTQTKEETSVETKESKTINEVNEDKENEVIGTVDEEYDSFHYVEIKPEYDYYAIIDSVGNEVKRIQNREEAIAYARATQLFIR